MNELVNITNTILSQINCLTLYEKGLLSEPNKIKLELIINERKLKLKQGYVNKSQNKETRFRKILKEWFADEKAFIDELKQLINTEPDTEFIKGKITLRYIPSYNEGWIEIIKGIDKRRYTVKRYYDLHLQNWESTIDNAESKEEKMQAISNAIFDYEKDLYDNDSQEIQSFLHKNIDHLKKIEHFIKGSSIEPTSITTKPTTKYNANEYALAYIFDLDAHGKQIPSHPTEGGNDKKTLMKIGEIKGLKGDTFYRAVLKILKYDRNNTNDLNNISNRWIEAVKQLSQNWDITSKYLASKGLIGED